MDGLMGALPARDRAALERETMSTTHFDPFRDLLSLQDRMNRLFQESLSRSRGQEDDVAAGGAWSPPVDIYEGSESVVLRADLPGLSQDEIDLRIENGQLRLRGTRPLPDGADREEYHRIERPFGTFVRVFALPNSVDVTRVKAEFKNGVLEVTLPKRQEAVPRPVKIHVE
jgi:HSP20 family protein